MAQVDTLRADIVSWLLDRTDIIPNIDGFIALAEADFNDQIRTREMQKTAVLTQQVDGSYTLPADFIEWQEANLANSTARPLKRVGEDFFAYNKNLVTSGPAKYLLIRSSQILLVPEPAGTTLQFRYYGKIPSILDGDNWLYSRRPGAYLFTCCKYAAKYLANGELEDRMGVYADREIEKLSEADGRNRWAKTTVMFQDSRSGPRP